MERAFKFFGDSGVFLGNKNLDEKIKSDRIESERIEVK